MTCSNGVCVNFFVFDGALYDNSRIFVMELKELKYKHNIMMIYFYFRLDISKVLTPLLMILNVCVLLCAEMLKRKEYCFIIMDMGCLDLQ